MSIRAVVPRPVMRDPVSRGPAIHRPVRLHRRVSCPGLVANFAGGVRDYRCMTNIEELRSLLVTTDQLLGRGLSSQALTRAVASGELIRLRPGFYVEGAARELHRDARHLLSVLATDAALDSPVFSHSSAALIHGLPHWGLPLRVVDVTEQGEISRSRISNRARIYTRPLSRNHVTSIDGLLVTNAERTVTDLAMTMRRDAAVVAADAALAGKLITTDSLDRSLEQMTGRAGVKRARTSLGLVDGRSESVAETRSRLTFADYGLPEPELQVDIYDDDGNWVARVDFLWPEFGLIGECDGFGKYFDGVDMAETRRRLAREKDRDAALIALGYRVLHWRWNDLENPQFLAERIRKLLFAAAA